MRIAQQVAGMKPFAGAVLLLVVCLSTPSNANASTIVLGVISLDTTWTLAGSPYILAGDVAVQGTSGADLVTTLTIQPGVHVLFNSNVSLTIGSNFAGNPGSLVAIGTAAQPILFSSNQVPTPTAGFWQQIAFLDYSVDATSTIQYATIEGAGLPGAIYLYYSAPFFSNLVFQTNLGPDFYVFPPTAPEAVPEPATLLLVSSGAALVSAATRRRRTARRP